MVKRGIEIKTTLLDRAIETVAPQWGANRMRARMSMALAGAYTGGRRDRRATEDWKTSPGDADSDLLPDMVMLRERSRDLIRNNPLAAGAIHTKVTGIVGTGLKVQSHIDGDYLGLTDDQAAEWQSKAERIFTRWCHRRECDLERTLNFDEIQDLALRSTFENGDVFGLLPMRARAGSAYETRLQLVEGDRCSNPNWSNDTKTLSNGVEHDEYGMPSQYWLTDQHPGKIWGRGALKWNPYPAFDSAGNPLVLHVYRKLRVGQSRGVPDLAPVIESLKQLGRYTDAELMAAVISGMFTVFVKTESGDADLLGLGKTAASPTNSKEDKLALGNGAIVGLRQGEDIITANPGRPNAGFDPFVLAIIRQIGVALELPYELMIKHFTASYSASRAALLEAWRSFKTRRQWFASIFCQPCYDAVIAEAIGKGWLSAPGFFKDPFIRAAYLGTEWVGNPMGQLNPQAETAASEDRIRLGQSSYEREAMESGGVDYWDMHRQAKREFDARKRDGLPLVGINRAPIPAQPVDQNN